MSDWFMNFMQDQQKSLQDRAAAAAYLKKKRSPRLPGVPCSICRIPNVKNFCPVCQNFFCINHIATHVCLGSPKFIRTGVPSTTRVGQLPRQGTQPFLDQKRLPDISVLILRTLKLCGRAMTCPEIARRIGCESHFAAFGLGMLQRQKLVTVKSQNLKIAVNCYEITEKGKQALSRLR